MDKRIKQTETEKEVIRIIKSRWKKGRDTYGVGLHYNQKKTSAAWIDEAIEEAADLLQYLVAMKMLFQRVK